MPDYCSINQYFCVTQYVSNLMSIFDPNSTPVCLLELCHLCQRIITDVCMCHKSNDRRLQTFYMENDHKLNKSLRISLNCTRETCSANYHIERPI